MLSWSKLAEYRKAHANRNPRNGAEEPKQPAMAVEGMRRANRVHEAEAGLVEEDPDPHRRTFTGEAVGRWGGRAGQPGKPTEKRIARRSASSDGR